MVWKYKEGKQTLTIADVYLISFVLNSHFALTFLSNNHFETALALVAIIASTMADDLSPLCLDR